MRPPLRDSGSAADKLAHTRSSTSCRDATGRQNECCSCPPLLPPADFCSRLCYTAHSFTRATYRKHVARTPLMMLPPCRRCCCHCLHNARHRPRTSSRASVMMILPCHVDVRLRLLPMLRAPRARPCPPPPPPPARIHHVTRLAAVSASHAPADVIVMF